MKQPFQLLLVLFSLGFIMACNNEGEEKPNPLSGRVFRSISELPELNGYKEGGGAVIDAGKDANGNYQFAYAFWYNKENTVCVFEEILKADETGKVKYKILDTINVGQASHTNFLVYGNCRQDTTWDSKIIALVVAEDEKPFYDKIIKAWRVNFKTGKIEKVKDTRGINCNNEGFGESPEDYTDELNKQNKTADSIPPKNKTGP